MYKQFNQDGFIDLLVPSDISLTTGLKSPQPSQRYMEIRLNLDNFDLSPVKFINAMIQTPLWVTDTFLKRTFLRISPNFGDIEVKDIINDIEYPYDYVFTWIMNQIGISRQVGELIIGTEVAIHGVTVHPKEVEIILDVTTYISFDKTNINLTPKN